MSHVSPSPADLIAGDLAIAIHQGLLRPGEQVPPQSKLMESYGVANATASSALSKLAAAGLTRVEPGRGTFVAELHRVWNNPVLDVMAASKVCRTVAAMGSWGTGQVSVYVGGDPDWDASWRDPEKTNPPREVQVAELDQLDRHLLRWMSQAFLSAARRIVATGQTATDLDLVEAARAILRDGARRPEGQSAIAQVSGPEPDDENVARRIWPERGLPVDPDGPPF